MPVYVEIAVNVSHATGVFTYHLPPELEEVIKVGQLVLVPFGQQTVQGVVFQFTEQSGVSETKAVLELVDEQAVLTEAQIQLAKQISHECLATLASCLGIMLPPGLEQRADVLYTSMGKPLDHLNQTQKMILNLLDRRGPLRGQQIDHAMSRRNWREAIRELVQRKAVSAQPVLPEPRVKPKTVRTVRLAVTPDAISERIPQLGKDSSAAHQRRKAVLDFLVTQNEAVAVSRVYAESGGNAQDLLYLSQRGLVILEESQTWRDPLEEAEFKPFDTPVLTKDQRKVWEEVQTLLDAAAEGNPVPPVLLHGVTGSGKTEIYLQAVRYTLDQGRQAIILVPEIALTPQTVRRFAGRFPDQTGLVHSGLSPGERYDTWRRARQGELGLVVGPRSALFTPFDRLGLVVVDECHDDTYYQWEMQPHYHAREAALSYARLVGAVCLLGSATPDVRSMYRAQQGEMRYLRLPERILAHRQVVEAQMNRIAGTGKEHVRQSARFKPLEAEAEFSELPEVSLVDMRLELQTGNRSIFSRPLQAALKNTIEQEQQAILFLNRRGSATFVFCRDCGHTLKCPRCELPLTYHEAEGILRCHYCGYERKYPQRCPNCSSLRIRHYGTGTQKVESEVQALFPGIRTLRWDYETTRRKGAHEAILNQFVAHKADVLIGTQMLAKGLDLPLVTLVGVVLADVGLSLPDYRTSERLFQVLTQVAGRAGRSPLGGQVILQTFQPEHYVIQAAARHDYLGFFQQELDYLKRLEYPPFTQLARLEIRHHDPERAKNSALRLASRLQGWLEQEGRLATHLVGPTPCFFARMRGQYRWQIVMKGPDPAAVLRGRDLGEWIIEINPPTLL